MSAKRDYEDVDDGQVAEPQHKRPKKQPPQKQRQHQNSGIDPTWGQKYVFSGAADSTTIPKGEESDFEDDSDAMAYLMSVRKQANAIPHLLVAPKVQIGPQLPAEQAATTKHEDTLEEEEYGGDEGIDRTIYASGIYDPRGYYEDGAYIAAPDEEEDAESYGDDRGLSERIIRESYFACLLDRYLRLRTIVHAQPPPNAHSRLPRSLATNKVLARDISHIDPHPLQMALLSKDTVVRALGTILRGEFLCRGHPLSERTSRWLWALLARLPDRGELNHNEIAWVRDLGRRAVLLGRSLAEMAALREELAGEGLGVDDAVNGGGTENGVFADGETEVDYGAVQGDEDFNGGSSPAGEDNPQQVGESLADALDHPESAEEVPGKEDNASEDGEIQEDSNDGSQDDDEDVAMDLASNSSYDSAPAHVSEAEDLETAKARLLAALDRAGRDGSPDARDDDPDDAQDAAGAADRAERERSRMNMRATITMILSVAGEFYGQRDLLEFRDPFVGMSSMTGR